MPLLFDRALVDRHQRRARSAAPPGADFLLDHAVDDLFARLMGTQREFALALDLGSSSPALGADLVAAGKAGAVVRLARDPADPDALTVVGDEEALPFRDASLDLAVSALSLHWVNDLPGAFAQIRRALRPDGLFLAILVGGDSLIELRLALSEAETEIRGGAAPRVSPFADHSDLARLLQRAGFALPVTDRDRLTVRYASMLDLMADLRAMGATNALVERDRRPLPRAVLFRAAEIYAERYSDPDGRVRATFDLMSLSGWAPDPSQQKPLRPGSATTRLADAVGSVERSAGEKADPGKR